MLEYFLLPSLSNDEFEKKILQKTLDDLIDRFGYAYLRQLSYSNIKKYFHDGFWLLPEAVNTGFDTYLKILLNNSKSFISYHKKNKKECDEKCFVCNLERELNER